MLHVDDLIEPRTEKILRLAFCFMPKINSAAINLVVREECRSHCGVWLKERNEVMVFAGF
jgi:hypothetical protein